MINCCIISITILLICFYTVNKFINYLNGSKYKHTEILEIFDYFLSKAYDTIYEVDLITHITNNVSLSKDERETYERNFIKRSILYMGKRNLKMFDNFFGDRETVVVNMINYMRKRINSDGLTKIINEQQTVK